MSMSCPRVHCAIATLVIALARCFGNKLNRDGESDRSLCDDSGGASSMSGSICVVEVIEDESGRVSSSDNRTSSGSSNGGSGVGGKVGFGDIVGVGFCGIFLRNRVRFQAPCAER